MEKRIGKRQQIRTIPMAWAREPERPPAFGPEENPDGRIVDLSVSGMGIVARTDESLEVGDQMVLACLGTIGRVYLRRIEHHIYPGESFYGVEFAEPNGPLTLTMQQSFLAKLTHAPTVYLPQG